MFKKVIVVLSLIMVGQSACGSLVSIKGPSFGAACSEGQVNTGGSTGGIKVGPFVDIEGPSVNHCVDASSVQKAMIDGSADNNSADASSDIVLLQTVETDQEQSENSEFE